MTDDHVIIDTYYQAKSVHLSITVCVA